MHVNLLISWVSFSGELELQENGFTGTIPSSFSSLTSLSTSHRISAGAIQLLLQDFLTIFLPLQGVSASIRIRTSLAKCQQPSALLSRKTQQLLAMPIALVVLNVNAVHSAVKKACVTVTLPIRVCATQKKD